jgi:hypothetical protein
MYFLYLLLLSVSKIMASSQPILLTLFIGIFR